jgi:hypothetical protein
MFQLRELQYRSQSAINPLWPGLFLWQSPPPAAGVVLFAQTAVVKIARQFRLKRLIRWNTTLPKNDKHKDYARYAAYCLDMMAEATDQESRCLCRDMAAEWLLLANALRPRRKSWQVST